MGQAFDSIVRGLDEAISHANGQNIKVNVFKPKTVDVTELRKNMGMTQEEFAARFGFSVATLRHWERGDRSPQGASLVLLNVIKRTPEAVTSALNNS
jgi:putative transcriptional regulator